MNIADIISSHRPQVRRVTLMLDGELADNLKRTRQEYRDAVRDQAGMSSNEVAEAKARVDELEAAADEASAVFVFQAVPKSTLDDLKRKHPPTEEVWDRYKARLQANPLLSPPEFDPEPVSAELLAVACTDPVMSVEDAHKLMETLSDGDVALLLDAAWGVSMQGSDRPLSKTAISGT